MVSLLISIHISNYDNYRIEPLALLSINHPYRTYGNFRNGQPTYKLIGILGLITDKRLNPNRTNDSACSTRRPAL